MEAITMNVQNIELIFLEKIKEAIAEIGDHDVKITLLKKIANQSIDAALNRTQYNGLNPASVSAMFSGRGRAWAKIDKDSGTAWNITKSCLQRNGKAGIDLLDMFETKGFAWLRYAGTNKMHITLHARYEGSKVENHFKVLIPTALINQINNLEGVPHNLGLESGNFLSGEDGTQKEIIDIEVSNEELSSFGIQRLEDLI